MLQERPLEAIQQESALAGCHAFDNDTGRDRFVVKRRKLVWFNSRFVIGGETMMFGKVFERKCAMAVFSSVFLAVAGMAATAGAVSLEIGTISGRAGNQVTVPLVLASAPPGVNSIDVRFTYDAATFSIGACASGISFAEINTATPGEVVLGGVQFPFLEPGIILTCDFTVSAAAPTGSLPLVIDPASVVLTNAETDAVITDYALVNGAVVVTSFTLPALTSTLNVPVSYTPAANGSLSYCVTESDTPGTCTWSGTPPASYTFAAQGVKRLYAYTKDAAGHVSFAGDAPVNVDLPPVVTDFVLPAMYPSNQVPVTTLTADDGTNGSINDYCLSETNSSAGCVWSVSKPTSYTFSALGSKTLYAFARDIRNQVSVSRSASVVVEQRPTITAFTLQDPSSSLTVPITVLTAIDNGTVSYCVTGSNDSGTCSWNSSPPATFTFGTEGAKTLYAFAKDNKGYLSDSSNATVTIDLPPTITAFVLPVMVASLDVPVTTLTATDGGAVEYCLAESNLSGGCVWSATKPSSYLFGSLGSKTLYSFARDSRGQISPPVSATVLVEALPSVTFSLPVTSASLTVPVTLSVSDNGTVTGYCLTETSVAGCSWSEAAPASYTFSTQGIKTLHAFARDERGNVSETRSATVVVDLPPTVTAFTLPAMVTSMVVPVTSLTATDGGSIKDYCLIESASPDGCSWNAVKPESHTFGSLGSKVLYAFARDNAGQVSSALSATVLVDALPTVFSFSLPATYGDLTVPVYSFEASDNSTVAGYCLTESAIGSGCVWSAVPIAGYSFTTPGLKTLYAFAKDNLGNLSAPVSLDVDIVLRVNLNVTIAGSVPGTVDSNSILGADPDEITCDAGTCSASFVLDDTVYLAATPAWYGTVQWSGCTDAAGSECQVLMNADKNITATFVPQGNARLSTNKATYPTIQAAYNAASGGAIELKEQDLLAFLENLDFNRAITVTLDGGKNDSFAAVAGRLSAVEGKVKISKGKVIVKKLVIR